ncbi:LuxR C-terminal-related transcriptional regulator [Nocardioides daeguensis]|uniref:LuxR C-terminal-related transcriptional regulator n=1 Tax=Nocardioides daeguensis TaxID=908359 RepID=A0ABP6WBE7_9ACTN
MATLPALRSDTVARPRVQECVDACVQRTPLTIVTAPSGFGKTTAVAEWARTRDDLVWVSASAVADSFTIVRGCLLAALPEPVQARLAARDPEEPPPDSIDLLAWLSEPRVLVIDDAHVLDAEAVRHTLASEALLASGLVTVVLIGQPGLEQSFAREVAAGRACVVRAADLAFDVADIAELLSLSGTPNEIDPVAVREETGGWPVAVRLRVLGGESTPDLTVADTSYDQLIGDYIEYVVLERLPEDQRTFVLEASTCARVTEPLVRRLTGRDDSAALLAQCYRAGIFLDRFAGAGEEEIYRWHDTFVAHAHAIRQRRDPQRARELHLVAAHALVKQYPAAAVEQALLAQAPSLAADIIRGSWLGLLLASQTTTLQRLCLSLPEELHEDPDILLIRACCCDIAGEQDAAEALRRRAAASATADSAASEFVRCFSELYLLSDPFEKAGAADRAYEVLAAHGSSTDAYALFLLGWVELRLRRDPERAIEVLSAATRVAAAEGNDDLVARAHANLAFALTYGGHFGAAVGALDAIDDARIVRSDWETFDGGLAICSRGFVHFWRGELHQALAYFGQMVREGGNDGSFLGLGRVYYAMTVAALGREVSYDEAEYNLSLVSNHDRHGVPWESYKRVAAARLLEARGKAEAALEVAESLLNRERMPLTHVLIAETYRRLGEPSLAHIALQRIDRRSRPPYAHVYALATAAALNAERGQQIEAHRFLERALLVAQPEASWFPFLSRDAVLTDLIASHPRSGHSELLLAEVARLRSAMADAPGESLTAREQEILHYLRTSMTTQEIADELHLSLNTIKTHLRAIYRKLGVANRRGAVRLMG